MKITVIAIAFVSAACLSNLAFSQEAVDLAKEKQCLSCHAVDKTLLAPSFKDIAKKYKGQKNVEGALVTQIVSGSPSTGGYHWGTMKMPGAGARPTVSVPEANKLLDWILAQ